MDWSENVLVVSTVNQFPAAVKLEKGWGYESNEG